MKKRHLLAVPGLAIALALILVTYQSCAQVPIEEKLRAESALPTSTEFFGPTPVTVRGYAGGVMEPFVSRDGRYLFFNGDSPSNAFKIYYAERIDPMTFAFRGEVNGIAGARTVVPSMDESGNFYFVSDRSYCQNFMTLFRGQFRDGTVTNVAPVRGLSLGRNGWFNMDAEISPDGNILYYTTNFFESPGCQSPGMPKISTIGVATRNPDGSFTRAGNSDEIFRNINTGDLNYAPAVSRDGLQLFFTRVKFSTSGVPLYMRVLSARRNSVSEPFGPPSFIPAGDGLFEAATLSPNGTYMYYHKVVVPGKKAALYMLRRR